MIHDYDHCQWCGADLTVMDDEEGDNHMQSCDRRPGPHELCGNCGLEFRHHRQHGPGCSYFEQSSAPERHPS